MAPELVAAIGKHIVFPITLFGTMIFCIVYSLKNIGDKND